MAQEVNPEPPSKQITVEQKASFIKELEEKGGLNNFRADFEGGYRRIGFQDNAEAQQKKDPNKRLGKSMREYWDDIDTAIEKEGIDKEKIRKLQEDIINGAGSRKELMRELNTLLLPVYLRLRTSGYSHEDLTS